MLVNKSSRSRFGRIPEFVHRTYSGHRKFLFTRQLNLAGLHIKIRARGALVYVFIYSYATQNGKVVPVLN
jgi:hypothetical protein